MQWFFVAFVSFQATYSNISQKKLFQHRKLKSNKDVNNGQYKWLVWQKNDSLKALVTLHYLNITLPGSNYRNDFESYFTKS